MNRRAFIAALQELIHRHAIDTDIPDFVIADYLMDALEALEHATKTRSAWLDRHSGRIHRPGCPVESALPPEPLPVCSFPHDPDPRQ